MCPPTIAIPADGLNTEDTTESTLTPTDIDAMFAEATLALSNGSGVDGAEMKAAAIERAVVERGGAP